MRIRTAVLLIFAFFIVCTASYLIANRNSPTVEGWRLPETPADRKTDRPDQPIPVALNRGSEVLDGFRGKVHPLLFGQTRMEVTAYWTRVGEGRDQLHVKLNPTLYAWFKDLRPN